LLDQNYADENEDKAKNPERWQVFPQNKYGSERHQDENEGK